MEIGFFKLAKNISKYSDHRFKLGCVLVNKRKPVAIGFNQCKTHPFFANPELSTRKSVHAETQAIINSDYKKFNNGKAYIYREHKDGTIGNARPCENCREILRSRGIRKLYYTIEEYPFWRLELL